MTAVVFTGPTLAVEDARPVLDAVYLPPAEQGDVYRVALQKPRAIGIIDGYFERRPAVWHKEILWAMAQGIHVFGSASMGALRAAELAAFGMRGVGTIFEQLARGEIVDDDEVAIAHGMAESNHRPLSEAMVNVRATLQAAVRDGVISQPTSDAVARIAKRIFYFERTYPTIFEHASDAQLAASEIAALGRFVVDHRVDQKRLDGLAMLRAMGDFLAGDPEPKLVSYAFHSTDAWEQFIQRVDRDRVAEGKRSHTAVDLLEEVAVSGHYPDAQRAALLRVLAAQEAARHHVRVSEDMLTLELAALHERHGLASMADLERWMHQHKLDWNDMHVLLNEEAQLRWISTVFEPEVVRALGKHWQVTGQYVELQQRVEAKRRRLDALSLQNPCLDDISMTREQLWQWYFEHYLGREMPKNLDRYAESAGFENIDAMCRAVMRAYLCRE